MIVFVVLSQEKIRSKCYCLSLFNNCVYIESTCVKYTWFCIPPTANMSTVNVLFDQMSFPPTMSYQIFCLFAFNGTVEASASVCASGFAYTLRKGGGGGIYFKKRILIGFLH